MTMRSFLPWKVLCLLLACSVSHAFYENDGVVNLDSKSFKEIVKGDGIFLVEFYAPWCGACKSFAPAFKEAAKALQGIATVAAIDADGNGDLGGEFHIKAFPTIKLMYFKNGKRKTVQFKGGDRSAGGIVDWTLQQAKKVAMGRIGLKPGKEQKEQPPPPPPKSEGLYGPKSGLSFPSAIMRESAGLLSMTVVKLTDANFHKEVQSDDLWMVEFYAPWCGHCQRLKGDWEELASETQGRAKIGAVDCTANEATCSEFGVQSYPTIKFFGENKDSPSDYRGGRTADALEDFIIGEWKKLQPPPEAKQLVDQHVFETDCIGGEKIRAKKLCFLAFLPHLLDSKASGRRAYLKVLNDLVTKYEDRPFSYLWLEGGTQPALEKAVEVGGYGYPAFIALRSHDKVYATLRDSFDLQHCSEFIERLRVARERTSTVSGDLPELQDLEAWDGGEFASEGESVGEYSLDDLMADDKEL